MMRHMSRRRFIGLSVANFGLLNIIGCGTVLHPERRGQPAGRFDWSIVALDAVGLLCFFVPGVIAFAVDFNNGTIYLPSDRYGQNKVPTTEKQLVTIKSQDELITIPGLEKIVSRHIGREVRLTLGNFRTQKLGSLDEFWEFKELLAGV